MSSLELELEVLLRVFQENSKSWILTSRLSQLTHLVQFWPQMKSSTSFQLLKVVKLLKELDTISFLECLIALAPMNG